MRENMQNESVELSVNIEGNFNIGHLPICVKATGSRNWIMLSLQLDLCTKRPLPALSFPVLLRPQLPLHWLRTRPARWLLSSPNQMNEDPA